MRDNLLFPRLFDPANSAYNLTPKKNFNKSKEIRLTNGMEILILFVCCGKFFNHQCLSFKPFFTSLK